MPSWASTRSTFTFLASAPLRFWTCVRPQPTSRHSARETRMGRMRGGRLMVVSVQRSLNGPQCRRLAPRVARNRLAERVAYTRRSGNQGWRPGDRGFFESLAQAQAAFDQGGQIVQGDHVRSIAESVLGVGVCFQEHAVTAAG